MSSDGDNTELTLSTTKNNETVTTGTSIIQGFLTYIQNGGKIVSALQAGIIGVVFSPLVALSNIIQAIGSFFATPFLEGGIAIGELINAIFTAPARLVDTGFNISRNTLSMYMSENLAGLLAGPVALGIVLLGLWLVSEYLAEPETGDTLPGLPFDVPDIGPLQFGVEEEDPDEGEG